MEAPRVVIVGGGFGGLHAARVLAGKNVAVTLVDKNNYHLFQPLLYQVAMASLSPAEIAYPLRTILSRYKNIDVLLGQVDEVNLQEKWIQTDANKLYYDYLILACGSTYTYFNSPQWEPYAPGLKTIAQATEIRKRVFLAFEKAERETDQLKKKKFLTFVVVGGGPTGVELAGTLGEIVHFGIARDFTHINTELVRIILIEAGPKILPTMTDSLSLEAVKELGELGVEVRINSKVIDLNQEGILVGSEFIDSSTILWAAGVAANPINKKLNTALDKANRIIVTTDLSLPANPNVFVVGDQAHFKSGPEQSPLPGLAPAAMQEGKFVAKNILREISGKKRLRHFVYRDKGQLATIGRSRAVGIFNRLEIHGLIAWLAWLIVHIYYLIGFKNKFFVLLLWAWTYLTNRRGARLIIN